MSFHIEMESSETNRVFIRRKKSTVFVDRCTRGLRVAPRGSSHHFFFLFVLFASFLLGISSTFSLASRLALPGSESVFGLSQGPPVCHVHL